jgi:hypothetical protein
MASESESALETVGWPTEHEMEHRTVDTKVVASATLTVLRKERAWE